MVKELDGRRMTTREAAHEELFRVLKLPAYYGRNLDALWDLVSTMEATVTLSHLDELLGGLGEYGRKLVATLSEAARENPDFRFTVRRNLDCLPVTLSYYSALAGMDLSRASQGVTFLPSPVRDESLPGYGETLSLLAVKRGDRLVVSCGRKALDRLPALYPKLHGTMKAGEIAQVLSEVYGVQAHHSIKYFYAGDGEQGDGAVTLTGAQYEDFRAFFRAANPGKEGEPDWLREYFDEITARRACCGVYQQGRLVSCTDGPSMPFLADRVQELGIHTLPDCRGQGLAQTACRRAIAEQLALGRAPLWSAGGGNIPSQRLAESLGFEKLADCVYITL